MDSKIKTEEHRVEMEQIVLGSLVLKLNLPMMVVDQINEICDAAKDRRFNDSLAGKIFVNMIIFDLSNDSAN